MLRASFLEKQLINNNVTVVFKDTIDEIIHKSSIEANAFLRFINVVVSPIRDGMSKVINTFKTHFRDNSQISLVPIEVLTLISLFIDSVDFQIKHFHSLQSHAHSKLYITFRKIKERNQFNLQGTSSTMKLL